MSLRIDFALQDLFRARHGDCGDLATKLFAGPVRFLLDFGRRIAIDAPGEVQRDPEVIRAYLGEEMSADSSS